MAQEVFSSVTELVLPCTSSFVVEDDKILLKLNFKENVGVVQHVVHHRDGSIQLLKNFKISIYDVINLTDRYEENEKIWGIHTLVDCKDDDFEKMKEEIRDILNAHDEMKCSSEYNFVGLDSIYPIKMLVKTPCFEHYMEVRRKVLSEILEI
ncbi:hypothetical protein C5167_025502 [Papaver somniferum]|uniref:Uncharacterized protein n=1 Tax=Papaver somniferum TaxID=3469 RepID=A0A4Y7JRL8_PAPSO|nr:hypothetical protein C5167_025502 [Papaver somniferum]